MPKNLELKAPCDNLRAAAVVAHELGACYKGVIRQQDIYYTIARGRLKLRIIDGRKGELIYYSRQNKRGGRYSNYTIVQCSDYKRTNKILKSVLGEKNIVRKKRRLFLYRNSRIHLDSVQGLGDFIEFEVIATQGKRQASTLLQSLQKAFHIEMKSSIDCSYSDLLAEEK